MCDIHLMIFPQLALVSKPCFWASFVLTNEKQMTCDAWLAWLARVAWLAWLAWPSKAEPSEAVLSQAKPSKAKQSQAKRMK